MDIETKTSLVDTDSWALIQTVMFTDEGMADPYPYYEKLHERGSDFLTPDGSHVVIGYDAIASLFRSPHFSKARPHDPAFTSYTPEETAQLNELESDTTPFLISMDAPDHTRLRSLVQRSFMPRFVNDLRPLILATIKRLLHNANPKEPFDMHGSFGAIFAPEIVGELIGLPCDQRETVSELTVKLLRGIDPGITFHTCLEGLQASKTQREYIRQVVIDRRKNPKEDLVTSLVQTSDDQMSEAELIRLIQVLYIGGYETTAHMIGSGILALLRNPEQFELLKADMDQLMRPAVDEMLRYETAISYSYNVAYPKATILDQPADEGAIYFALLSAANRDPKVFENPGKFDIMRAKKPNMSFGGGAHLCLGINLAKVELELAFRELITRFPNMKLAEANPPRAKSFQQQSYQRVPVILAP